MATMNMLQTLRKQAEERNAKKFTQDAVARAIGISVSTFQRFEYGRADLTIAQAQKLADYYGVPVAEVAKAAQTKA